MLLACAGIPSGAANPDVVEGSRYLQVDCAVRPTHSGPPAVQVEEAPEYASWHYASMATVTVRISDTCASSSVSSTPDGTCSAWARAVEDALTSRGVQVVHWADYEAALKLKQDEAAARAPAAPAAPAAPTAPGDPRLAVQAIVVIDSGSLSVEGGAAEFDFRYFQASPRGKTLGPDPLDEALRSRLKDFVRGRVKSEWIPNAFIESRLSVSVVQTDTNHTVWSYNGGEERKLVGDELEHFLFGVRDGAFWPVAVPSRPLASGGSRDQRVAEEHVEPATERNVRDLAKAAVRQLADGVVSRFRGVTRGG